MRNIVIIEYKRSSCVNHGSLHKEDAAFYCHGGEHEAKILQRWLHDNLVKAYVIDQATYDLLPNEYPCEALQTETGT